MAEQLPELPQAVAAARSRGSPQLVWLIPIIAALIGGWLAVKSIMDKGPTVTIAFATAEGLETGKTKEAAALLRSNPVPSSGGLTPYTGFYIPRLLYLRGLLAEKEGRAADARSAYEKFLAISGPDPLFWGEEKRARQ